MTPTTRTFQPVHPSDLPSRDLLKSLMSRTCIACAGKKAPRNTLCSKCYHSLPEQLRYALYRRMGHGYAESVAAALNTLQQRPAWPHMPGSSEPLGEELFGEAP